jgi:hypothetical protein
MAGKLTLNKVQLGDSVTPANNFVIKQADTPNGTIVIQNGNDGTATTIGTITSTGDFILSGNLVSQNSMGWRNRIVNGDMSVWQRGTSFVGFTSGAYCADMIQVEPRNLTSVSITKTTDVPSLQGFSFSLRAAATNAADDGFHFRIPIELPDTGNYGQFVSGTTWTLSYWAKSTYSGRTITPYLYMSAAASDTLNASVPAILNTSTLTNNWQRFTHTVTLPSWVVENGSLNLVRCLLIRFIHGMDNTPQDTYITGIQFEPGFVASPFEHIEYGEQLRRCQRYYQIGRTGNAFTPYAGTPTAMKFGFQFQQTMRAAPILTEVTVDQAGTTSRSFSDITIYGAKYNLTLNGIEPRLDTIYSASAEL